MIRLDCFDKVQDIVDFGFLQIAAKRFLRHTLELFTTAMVAKASNGRNAEGQNRYAQLKVKKPH
jgi:hypothetical protein